MLYEWADLEKQDFRKYIAGKAAKNFRDRSVIILASSTYT
jgi:hypothetical protein